MRFKPPIRLGHACAVALGLTLTLGSGCHREQAKHAPPPQPKPVVKPAPPTPLDAEAAQLGKPTWQKPWDAFVERRLPAIMLTRRVPRDVRRFCPAFYRMDEADKRAWWAYFFEALASAEAGLKPTSNVIHTDPQVAVISPVTGEMTHQAGLLQLSYDDSRRYGCDFNWKADRRLPLHSPQRTILQPERNLACGIRILYHQLFRQHKPLYTPTSYWATLQPGTESFRVFERQMTNPPAACELHATRPAKAPDTTEIASRQPKKAAPGGRAPQGD